MRRLRRNWSSTKTDISRSITRIKKKSTASVADLSDAFKPSTSRREVSPEKSNDVVRSNKAESPSSPTLPSPPNSEMMRSTSSDGNKKKGTWAMRQIRRRMTVAPTYGGTSKKEASTFYLTLTIEQAATPVKYVTINYPFFSHLKEKVFLFPSYNKITSLIRSIQG